MNHRIHRESLEWHKVQTEDGYILTLLRLTEDYQKDNQKDKENSEIIENIKNENTKNENIKNEKVEEDQIKRKPKPVALLIHGLMCTGDEWLFNIPEKTLPCILAKDGYDVWMGSYRGSPISKEHTTLSPKSRKFWDFSGQEIGLYDVPALIDYILKVTGNESLFYIGHSLGNTVLFVALSLKPEYNAKIKAVAALCPAVYGKHVRKLAVKMGGPMGTLTSKMRILYQREACSRSCTGYAKMFCPPFKDKIGVWMLTIGGKIFGNFGTQQVEKAIRKYDTNDRMLEVARNLPSTTSMKLMCHIAQCFYKGTFQAYDYGRSRNRKEYGGQRRPPKYELGKTTVPVATFTSKHDYLIPAKDVAQVAKELGNVIGQYEIDTVFTHADFMVGKDADVLVYNEILKTFRKFRDPDGI